MALNLNKTIVDILKQNPNQYFIARQLAERIYETKREDCLAKMECSTATIVPINTVDSLLQQLVAEIGSRRPRILKLSANIKTTADRPRKYYYTEKTDIQEITDAERTSKENGHPEHDSYPLLCAYLNNELDIYILNELTKRNLQIPKELMETSGYTLILLV